MIYFPSLLSILHVISQSFPLPLHCLSHLFIIPQFHSPPSNSLLPPPSPPPPLPPHLPSSSSFSSPLPIPPSPSHAPKHPSFIFTPNHQLIRFAQTTNPADSTPLRPSRVFSPDQRVSQKGSLFTCFVHESGPESLVNRSSSRFMPAIGGRLMEFALNGG